MVYLRCLVEGKSIITFVLGKSKLVLTHQIIWVRIPSYAPSQGGAWEIMVKLFEKALNQTIENTRRTPAIIELQTFVIEAVRIVNDRPLLQLAISPTTCHL